MTPRHGGDIYGASQRWGGGPWTDFSSNINPLGVPDAILKAVRDSLVQDLAVYPDPQCRELRDALARWSGSIRDEVLPGNGVSQLLDLVLASLPGPVLVPVPSFGDYERILKLHGKECRFFALEENLGFRADSSSWRKALSGCASLVMGNPNNPTSVLLQRKEILSLLNGWLTGGGRLVLDESFIELIDDGAANSLWQDLRYRPNVVIFRSLTKYMALPGLRLGYLLSTPKTVSSLASRLPDWSVSGPACRAGLVLEQCGDYCAATARWLASERRFLASRLAEFPELRVFEGATNFLLCRLAEQKGQWLQEELSAHGILIRRCYDFRGLDDQWIRLAVKSRSDNENLLQALTQVFCR